MRVLVFELQIHHEEFYAIKQGGGADGGSHKRYAKFRVVQEPLLLQRENLTRDLLKLTRGGGVLLPASEPVAPAPPRLLPPQAAPELCVLWRFIFDCINNVTFTMLVHVFRL